MRRVGGQRRKESKWWNEELWVRWWPKPMTDTAGTESGDETGSPSCKKNGAPAMGRAIWE